MCKIRVTHRMCFCFLFLDMRNLISFAGNFIQEAFFFLGHSGLLSIFRGDDTVYMLHVNIN